MNRYFVLIAIILLAFSGCAPSTTAAVSTFNRFANRRAACEAAQDHIRAALKAPATAAFPSCRRQDEAVRTTEERPGVYSVLTYVDAQNSFGATLRQYFMCAVGDHVSCIETDRDHKQTLNAF